MTPPRPAAPDTAAPAPPVLDCHGAVLWLWDYLDGELPPAATRAVAAHLAACDECPPHFDFARTFLRAVPAARPGLEGNEPALRARVLAALRAESSAAPRAAGPQRDVPPGE